MPIITPGLLSRLPPPVLPKEIATVPHGEDWIYEFLWGGERVRAIKGDVGVWLMTRDGRNLSNRFPAVAAAVAKLRPASAVIDGEILLLDRCSPLALRFLSELCDDQSDVKVVLIAYDVLERSGEDLRHFPLLGRRLLLASLVQGTPIVLSPFYKGDSRAALREAAKLGVAGVVAKRAGSTYQPSALLHRWVKVTLPVAKRADAGINSLSEASTPTRPRTTR